MRSTSLPIATAFVLALALAAGCPPPPTGGECTKDDDCDRGQTCVTKTCVDFGGEGEGEAGEGEGAEGEGAEGEGAEGEGAEGEGAEGEGAEGEGVAGEGEGEGGPDFVGTDIAAIYAADVDNLDITLTGVVVTQVAPLVPSDDAGFFIQEGATGPAVFVAVDATTIPVVAGDTINAHVSARLDRAQNGGATAVSAIDSVTVTAPNADVDALRQDYSTQADPSGTIADFEGEAITLTGTIAGARTNGGGGLQNGHASYAITTAGFAVAVPAELVLRMPVAVETAIGAANLALGCTFSIKGNVARFNAKAEPEIFDAAQFTSNGCNAVPTTLLSASATDASTIAATFSAAIDAASITDATTQFTLAPSGSIASAAVNGAVVTLTTAAPLPDGAYTLSVLATVKDSTGANVTAGSANFSLGGAGGTDYLFCFEDANGFVATVNTASPGTATFSRVNGGGGTNLNGVTTGEPAPCDTLAGNKAASGTTWSQSATLPVATTTDAYFELIVDTGAGPLQLSFADQASGTGPAKWGVILDEAGVFTTLTSEQAAHKNTFGASTADLTAFTQIENKTGVHLRIYGYGATQTAGTWRIDNLALKTQ